MTASPIVVETNTHYQQLLKSDIIQHNIVPISGMQDLKDANEKLVSVDENVP